MRPSTDGSFFFWEAVSLNGGARTRRTCPAWIDCAVRTNRSDPRARAAALARPVRACFQPSAACRVSGAERASGLPPWSKARREG